MTFYLSFILSFQAFVIDIYTYDSFAVIVEVAPGTNAMAATLNIDTGAVAGNRMWKILVKCVECDSADR